MYQSTQVRTEPERESFCALPGPAATTPDALARQRPDALWLLADDAGNVAARCALWWDGTPPHGDHRLGLIGHYYAAGPEAAAELLRRACGELSARGCTLAVGPMDGNTWHRYRFVTERGTEPPFFLEPDNPDDWPAHFTAAGFTALAEYYSALNTDLGQQDPRTADIARRLEAQGVTLRTFRPERFEEELRRIHALSLASFRQNFLYTPIGEEEFVEQYRGVQPYVRPELVLIAEQRGEPVGYLFAVPDLLQARRGQAVDTLILKTLAVHPGHAGAGLGGLLAARCHEAACRLGFRRAVHALMHEINRSLRISSHTARVMRRYTLFARPLGPPP